jgi:hypothetical protein
MRLCAGWLRQEQRSNFTAAAAPHHCSPHHAFGLFKYFFAPMFSADIGEWMHRDADHAIK